MLKKIVCAILSVVLCGAVFTGCSLIEHNDSKDAQQVIVTINPITDGNFSSETRYIYKAQLNNQLKQNLGNYMQQNTGATQAEAVKHFIDQLVQEQLLIIDAERRIKLGELEWTKKEQAQLTDGIYTSLDNQLKSIMNDVKADRGESKTDYATDSNDDNSSSTYPTKKDETTEEDYTYVKFDENGNIVYQKDEETGEYKLDKDGNKIPEYIDYRPNKAKFPGLYGSEKQISLEVEAVNRLVELLKELVADDFRLTDKDRAKFAKDDENIAKAKKDGNEEFNLPGGAAAVYVALGETYYMEYLMGKSMRESLEVGLLQKAIIGTATVTDDEVSIKYDQMLAEQETNYDNNPGNYDTAVTGGTTTILYNPNDNYFYVKHILLPFNEEEKALVASWANDEKKIENRQNLAENIVIYPHVNGEDDKSNPKTLNAVIGEINAAMSPFSGPDKDANRMKEAERTFDDLIYKYNTDNGIFDKPMGYAVKRDDEEKHSGYMEEFYHGAMELYNNPEYSAGDVLADYVVTDYGVHVMYYASNVKSGAEVGLYSPQTPGRYKTYFDIIKETSATDKEKTAFDEWAATRMQYFIQNGKTVIYNTNRYKDLLGE